jgi:hypothetical protein
MFACSTLQARLYRYCTYISVSDPDSIIPDPDPAFKAAYQSGSGSRVFMKKIEKNYTWRKLYTFR